MTPDPDPDELPEMPDTMPEYHERSHYAAVVALLRAINVKANVTFNGAIFGIQVRLDDKPVDGKEAVWSNYDNWACTIVEPGGDVVVHNSGVKADCPPDVAAKVIAFTDYDAGGDDG